MGKVAIASTVVFTYMQNLSIPAAVKTILNYAQSNPLGTVSYSYLFKTYVPQDIACMTIGGWICWQSITTLITAVAQKNWLNTALAASGYLLGKFIIDLSMYEKCEMHPTTVIKHISKEAYKIISSLYGITQSTTKKKEDK